PDSKSVVTFMPAACTAGRATGLVNAWLGELLRTMRLFAARCSSTVTRRYWTGRNSNDVGARPLAPSNLHTTSGGVCPDAHPGHRARTIYEIGSHPGARRRARYRSMVFPRINCCALSDQGAVPQDGE